MGSPPVVELVVVELVAVPPPAPVVLLVVELVELLVVELLVVELVELLVVELVELLVVELVELLVVELVASSPPAPPRPPAPPVPSAPPEPVELLTAAFAPALEEPPVAELVEPLVAALLVADPAEPAPSELDDGAPPELAEPPPPPAFSPSRLEPWAHAASIRSEMAQRAVAPRGQELASLTRWTSRGGAPDHVDLFTLEPWVRAAPDVIGPSNDRHLAIGRILNTHATARPNPKAERK